MDTTFPQQPLQQQQPPVVYPNTVTNQPTQPSRSDGSFGTVFIVLAVIVVVSAVACCLGRFCNRRHNKNIKPSKQQKQKNDKFRPSKEKDGNDIEFGFEKDLASKPMRNGEHHGGGGGGGGGGGRGFKTFHNGRINNIGNAHQGPMNGHNGSMNGPMNGHNGPMNGPVNGHRGPMNGHHGPTNGGRGGHFKGVTIAEPVFSVGEPKPGLGP